MADEPNALPDRIARAADDVFRACGFDGTEMRAIAERAGTSVGTLYNYYPSKWALFLRVLLDGWAAVKAEVRRVTTDPALGWHAKVGGILEAQMRYVARNAILWLDVEAMAGGAQRLPPGADPALLRQMMDWLIAEVGAVLATAGPARWRNDPERERLALALVSAAAALARHRPAEATENAALLRSLLAA